MNGPVVFLAKGTAVNRRFQGRKLEQNYGLPRGSCVIMTKTAYMDDEAWLECVEVLVKGIREMEVSFCALVYFV